MHLRMTSIQTPIGNLHPMVGPHGLCALIWGDRPERTEKHLSRHIGPWSVEQVEQIPDVNQPLTAYFEGDLQAIEHITLDPYGTPFQRRVWAALRAIPTGQTCSYLQLATAIGKPTAVRAVAQANGHNPIPLVVPCHRVIAANGGIGGFSCGIERKYWLLRHEGSWPHLPPI